MTMLGMPESMFLVFLATLVAGSLGAIHYVVAHMILGRPINEVAKERTTESSSPVKDRTTDGGHTDGRN
ncbi:hypothetical protein GCU68_18715 (plasmid) [Natronorubrum aibiense]|uniref:Uncharacterized protein n=1 Tax=Natronorubrum aibiense TaxID=348826 RepID=A0A5P9P8V3_9EURY|nr:hypothetical protein GCU68_18715 [Natronorubrum aibiense]